MARNPFAPLGRKYEKLGKLMQDQNTPITKLFRAAHDCGLSLQFRLVDLLQQEVAREKQVKEQSQEGE